MGGVWPQPSGRMGIAGDLFVVRRRRCYGIASSSLRDLTSQDPSANILGSLQRGTPLGRVPQRAGWYACVALPSQALPGRRLRRFATKDYELSRLAVICCRIFCVALAGFCSFLTPWAQGSEQHRTATAQAIEKPPILDGILSEPVWSSAPVLGGFLQRDPQEGEPSTERTEVRIVYTPDALYFGFRCFDSAPSRILATERRRDEDLTKDDSVAILLDTFRDRRNAFLFRTNPLGTQFDALVTDEGRDVNRSWDEKWEAAGSTDEEGWSAEIRIPFKTLRMRGEDAQVWGLELERLVRRKNEAVYWNNADRNFQFEDVSRAGMLSGIEGVDLGLRWRIKPYLLGGFEQFPDAAGRTETDNLSDVGLELLKFRPNRSMTVDLTVNTDFAETEVDDLVTNITRFPLFFPEKREFFLEGAGAFEFGTGGQAGGRQEFKMFHSRRVGLSPAREQIPMLGGVKLTGRMGPYTVGFINAQTDDQVTEREGEIPANNSTVFRLKRDLFERSYIGFMFANRDASEEGNYNRSYGADANFLLARNLTVQTFVAKTETPELPDDDWAVFGKVNWDSDFLLASGEHFIVQRNFNPELGFIERRDQRRTTLQFGVRPRPVSETIRQLVFRTRLDYYQNQDGKQESMQYHFFTFESRFQAGDNLQLDFHRNFERLFEPFQIQPDITIPIGTYRGWDMRVQWRGAPHRVVSGNTLFRLVIERGFFGGDRLELRTEPQIKINDSTSVDVGYALDDVNLPQGDFLSSVINTRFNYAFSNRWLTSSTVQYSNLDRVWNVRFRLNFIYRPGDDLFFIYNEGRLTNLEPGEMGLLGRSILVKFTHSFDF